MSLIMECDAEPCLATSPVIPLGTERADILTNAPQPVPDADAGQLHMHWPCYLAQGQLQPGPGRSVTVWHYGGHPRPLAAVPSAT